MISSIRAALAPARTTAPRYFFTFTQSNLDMQRRADTVELGCCKGEQCGNTSRPRGTKTAERSKERIRFSSALFHLFWSQLSPLRFWLATFVTCQTSPSLSFPVCLFTVTKQQRQKKKKSGKIIKIKNYY